MYLEGRTCEGRGKAAICKPGAEVSQTNQSPQKPTLWYLDLQLPALRIVRKYISVV